MISESSPQTAPMQSGRFRPDWANDLRTFYDGRIARQFVLHFNITDFAFDMSQRREREGSKREAGKYERRGEVVGIGMQPQTFREYLHSFLFTALRCRAIYTYSLARGIDAYDCPPDLLSPSSAHHNNATSTALKILKDAAEQLHIEIKENNRHLSAQQGQLLMGQDIDLKIDNDQEETVEAFKLFEYVLRTQHPVSPDTAQPPETRREMPVALILDYAEKLLPYQLGEGQGDRQQLQTLEAVQRWALDPWIRKTRNLIILLTTNIGQIPSLVYNEGSGCPAIRVPLPETKEREAYIYYLLTQHRYDGHHRPTFILDESFGKDEHQQASKLATETQGMRLTDIDNLRRQITVEHRRMQGASSADQPAVLHSSDVQSMKAKVIQAQSGQLLDIVPPVRGFNEIGGLEKLKKYLRKRTDLMKNQQDSPIVPSGLLLAGPPGTGKTIIAEALAKEGHFNLVKMRNIQDRWVGSSERNLDMVLSLLKDLFPVVVFIDEIDQAMGRRDTGQSGDSGVGGRMFARILEEMSNASNRGKILWVAATNRTDILDSALLRRFDRVVPLLVPDIKESCRIFAAMPAAISHQSGSSMIVKYSGDLEQHPVKDQTGDLHFRAEDLEKFYSAAVATTTMGLTGSGIEIVVRRAVEIAYEEKIDQNDFSDEIPSVEARHLDQAIQDVKPNHDRRTYEHQSLLALKACNFYSIIPDLPEEEIYSALQDEQGRIDARRLDEAIQRLENDLHKL
ncbi:hypothetical protein KDH_12540 [Dictyobacter sp. S3.2.2.5]|uniref:AAA+ ATPase domain-containing protein n=1 Tax=Dictyobacter halimunensis TaxID=3026934 RepID=A0ABQ6FL67_9CHLR|nr:hypothetical protein KDH_12540 [Dictyobacter sp. S3.2.2.5]